MASNTRYLSGHPRVDDVLGKVQKDVQTLETTAMTETDVDTAISAIYASSTTYTVATMNTAPTDGSVRFVKVSDGGALGVGGVAIFFNGHWVDSGTGDDLT